MKVFRITHKKWADTLIASGFAGRWNSNGKYMIYTAQNRSLCCLEVLVHSQGLLKNANFCVMTIEIPESIKIIEIKSENLSNNWNGLDEKSHVLCRQIGDKWIDNRSSAVLKVPSAIIPDEFNILINPSHIDFSKIKLKKVDAFTFDTRLF